MDLTGVASATLSYLANYQNFGGVDFLDVDASTDGGGTWAPLRSWNEDHGDLRSVPGEAVTLDLSAFAGSGSVIVRWRYYDPVGPADSGDWYAQIDDVALSCAGDVPGIALNMTVGSEPASCATSDHITVSAGATAYYCYAVTNTGSVTLTLHDLADSRLGAILGGFAYELAPGAAVDTVAAGLTLSATVTATTVSTGTWTAYNPQPGSRSATGGGFSDVVSATDSVTVTIATPTDVVITGVSAAGSVPVRLRRWRSRRLCTLAGFLPAVRRRAKALRR